MPVFPSDEKTDTRPHAALDRPVDRATIHRLFTAGYLSAADREATLKWLLPPRDWWGWVNRLLLFLGAALLLAGIVFFFAFNWARMSPFAKFALIEGALLACVVAAWIVGLKRITGQVLLLGAGLLVGVLLAVYGQVYQTGADAYELFVGWSLLILGWVIVARFGAFWLMWLSLINVGIMTYWSQVAEPNGRAKTETMFMLLALVNGAALVTREYGAAGGVSWLAPRWLRWVLLTSILMYLTISSTMFITEAKSLFQTSALSLMLLMATLAASYLFFRFRERDLLVLTMCALSACAVVLTAMGRGLFGTLGWQGAEAFLVFGLIVIGVFSAVAFWLRAVSAAMEGEIDA